MTIKGLNHFLFSVSNLKKSMRVHKFSDCAEALGYTDIKFLTDENTKSMLFSVWG